MSLNAWLDILQTPWDGLPLSGPPAVTRRAEGDRTCADQDILRLVWPATIEGRDAHWNRFYDRCAPFYDWSERVSERLFGIHTLRERAGIVDRLDLRPGMRVLEVSPGPGVYQRLLAERIGPSGGLVELDLSIAMLRACAKRARKSGLDPLLVQANGAYLPFADDSFDAVFHFGGVKLFNEPARALDEFVRVARPGAVVAWGDEGFGASAPTGLRRRLLQRINPGFLEPMPPLPSGIDTDGDPVCEVMNGCGWFVVARKATTVAAAAGVAAAANR